MKHVINTRSLAVGCALLVFAGWLGAQGPDAEEAIDALAAKYVEGWKAGDAAMCASIYAEDADVIDFAGQTFEGRSAIEASIAQTLEGYPGTSLSIERTTFHLVSPDVVVSDGVWRVEGSVGENLPTEGFYTVVASRGSGEWLIVSGRTKVAPEPVSSE
ncbi:MAG TPA: SgcJ/EcaC family oxidoreductase [Vicinamibacteria bacterium]|nr:SgcJ/EcaC family oxidoreductase [Vicinamibacteria bacterium]